MAELPEFLRPRRRVAAATVASVPMAQRLSWLGSWTLLGLSVLVFVVGVWALLHTLRQEPVAQLRVEGELQAAQRQVLESQLQPLINQGYFDADLTALRDAALTHSWVDRVVVSRHWPRGLVVRVLPRHPVARWGSGRLLDDRGEVFTEAQPVLHAELPLLHGPLSQSRDIMLQYLQINQWFAPLGLRLRELHLTERMTWFMQFDNGLRVIVDQEQTQAKLQRLSVLAQHGLAVAWPFVSAVDLRYRNGLSLQWKSGRAPLIQNGHFVQAALPAVVSPLPSIQSRQP